MGLLDQVKRMAGSPLTQGLLAGAAVGSAPFGLLMAPAISAVRAGAERDKTAAEMALEERALQLQAMRRQEEALGQLPGLLGPAMAQPVADSLMGPPAPGQGRATDVMNAQQGLLGAMTQIAPEQVAQGLLGQMLPQERAAPAGVREFEYLKTLPPELREQYMQFKNSGDGGLDQFLKQLQVMGLLREFNAKDKAAADAENEKTTQTELANERYNTAAQQADVVLDLLPKLEGTPLAPGTSPVISGAGRTASGILAMGADMVGEGDASASVRRMAENRDKLEKALAALRNTYVDLRVGEGATNQERAAAAEAFPTAQMESGAIRAGIGELFGELERQANINDPGEKRIEAIRRILDKLGTEVTVEFD